jgi:dipeptidyl aminopeptidase/acylaminoacyl peptidase
MVSTADYGSWTTPITADRLAEYALLFTHVETVGADLYWIEGRPLEGGRHVLVRRDAEGSVTDVTPAPYDVRSRVNEYGGRAVTIAADGTVYFVHYDDQGLYRQAPGSEPVRLTPEDDRRYMQPVIDGVRERIMAVCEDHRFADEPVHSLVAVPMKGGEPAILLIGRDFYAAPALSPDGRRLAYTAWDHPNMPWDTSVVRVAELADDGSVARDRWVAGGDAESVGAATWSPDGSLYLVSDRSDLWSLYRATDDGLVRVGAAPGELSPIGAAFRFADPSTVVAAVVDRGVRRLLRIDVRTGAHTEIRTDLTEIETVAPYRGGVAAIGGSPSLPICVVLVPGEGGAAEVIQPATDLAVDPALLPSPEVIAFRTEDGGTAHAFYYPPTNPEFAPPPGQRPPLLLFVHSGPVAATTTAMRCSFYAPLAAPFWTSRGYAVVDVDYRGSTGYGRAYRQALYGRWGEVDVDDAIAAARFLVERGDVDPARIAIGGGSAGGYTALAALAFRDFFAAGVSYFGVSDLEAFARQTHKYEKHYLSHLVAPWPEGIDEYRRRSPLHAARSIKVPLLVAQGTDDHVVLPEQSAQIARALEGSGVPVTYLTFDGEGHGFVRAETLATCLDSALEFLARVFALRR